jgi:predicted ATP-binding protein involved in virulence
MQQIAVKNFRVFGAPSMFDLSPVTILTGRNNAGKSSLIKALLLLADFIEQDDQTVLRLDGPRAPRHKITSFDNLKNWEVAEDVVRLSYTMGDVQFEYDFSRHAEPIMAQLTCFRIITPALKEELELKLVDEQGLSYYFTVRQALIDYIVNEDAYLALQSQSFLSEAAKAESRLAALDEEIVRKKAQFDKNPEMLRYQAVASAFAQLSSKREELTERIQELKASADSHKVRDKGLVYFGRVNLEEVDLGTTSLPRIIQHGLLAYIDADATRTAQELKYLAEQARSTLVRFYQELQQLTARISHGSTSATSWAVRLHPL